MHEEFHGKITRATGGLNGYAQKVVQGGLPDLSKLQLPYGPAFYSDEDIAHRKVYVEASRGCPFRCEFCLSALDKSVRRAPLETLLTSLGELIERGRRQFKFVDRTFNLDLATSGAILEFFLGHLEAGTELFVHFEMISDRLPEGLRALIRRFPPGSLQFEVGIQTFKSRGRWPHQPTTALRSPRGQSRLPPRRDGRPRAR